MELAAILVGVGEDLRVATGEADLGLPCLVPVANRPLAVNAVDRLARAGVRTMVVVGEPSIARAVGSVVGSGDEWGIDVSYVEVREATDALEAVREAADRLPDLPTFVHGHDALVCGDLEGCLHRIRRGDLDAVVMTSPEPRAGAAGIRRRFARAPGGAMAGVQILAADRVHRLHELGSTGPPILTLDDLGSTLLASEWRTETAPVERAWRYAPDTAAVLEVNRLALEDIVASVPTDRRADVEFHGRVALSSSARVSNSVLRGPVAVGPGARIRDAYIGPYTAVGAGTLIEGAEIEHSVVMANAEISHIGVRLEASVIGAGAKVTRTFGFPRALHLHVGAGARVSLS